MPHAVAVAPMVPVAVAAAVAVAVAVTDTLRGSTILPCPCHPPRGAAPSPTPLDPEAHPPGNGGSFGGSSAALPALPMCMPYTCCYCCLSSCPGPFVQYGACRAELRWGLGRLSLVLAIGFSGLALPEGSSLRCNRCGHTTKGPTRFGRCIPGSAIRRSSR